MAIKFWFNVEVIRLKEFSIEDKLLIFKDMKSYKAYIKFNNEPKFEDDEIKKGLEGMLEPEFEPDESGHCNPVTVCISFETLSHGQQNRPNIRSKPIGFPTDEENLLNDKLVFQRCHLIGYQLYAKINDNEYNENKNKKKIFTGTRFMNNEMFYHENRIARYIKGEKGKNKKRRVFYRVSPYYEGNNKLIYGVQMEAKFFDEDNKENKCLSFNIFVYNKQPDIIFYYDTGKIDVEKSNTLLNKRSSSECSYVINKKNKVFHVTSCPSIRNTKKRKILKKRKRNDLINMRYRPCPICDSL